MNVLNFMFYSIVLVAMLWLGNLLWGVLIALFVGVFGFIAKLFVPRKPEQDVNEYLKNLDKGTVTVDDEEFNSDNLGNVESEELVEG